ncbi:MAG: hypothetical protein NPIRA04_00650 [Nitrospirales bacterium]|nr:MAG: hypothetical protein NPIRA04_00650 [Nitrospirales bacterium]
MKSITKLIFTNIAVLLAGLFAVNFFFSIIIDGVYLYKKVVVSIGQPLYRESLPDQEEAQQIFRELRQLTKQYAPYMGWSRQPFSGVTTNVDPVYGERITPQSSNQPGKHIHFFGGSTMWGSGVDDQHTIPAHFHTLQPEYRVYNHAQSGFISRQGVARLVNLVNQNSKMDVVVFYDGCNDPLTLCRGDISINGHREESKIRQKLEHQWQIPQNVFTATHKAIRTIFKGGHRPPSRCKDDPGYAKTVATTMVNNWKIAKTIAAMKGADFHAILQPVSRLGRPNIDYLDEKYDGSEWKAVYPYVQAIKQKEHLTWLHDFSDAFDRKDPIYIDLCHVNSLGNEIIAKKLSQIISRLDDAS